jgi:hypothetical protein
MASWPLVFSSNGMRRITKSMAKSIRPKHSDMLLVSTLLNRLMEDMITMVFCKKNKGMDE